MFDMQILREILLTVGMTGLVVIIIAYAVLVVSRVWEKRSNVDARRDDMITTFAASFSNDLKQERERRDANEKELRDEFKSLQEKFHEADKSLAKEQGRREQMEKQINQQTEQIQKQGSKILELEKHQQANQARISELEAEIELLTKQLAAANSENSTLQAQKRELEKLLELEKNRADSLNRLVTQYQEEAQAAVPVDTPDVDDTIHPLPLPTNNAEESAEEQPS